MALRARAELRALHAHQRAAVVQLHALAREAVAAPAHDACERLVERVREGDVADDAGVEEGEGPDPLRAVDDLVRDDEVARLDRFAQRADGAEGDDGADAKGAQGSDVGAGGDFVGREFVVQAVTGKECDWD